MKRKKGLRIWIVGGLCACSIYYFWNASLIVQVPYPGNGVISDFTKKARDILNSQDAGYQQADKVAEYYVWLNKKPEAIGAAITLDGVSIDNFELIEGRFVSTLTPQGAWVIRFRHKNHDLSEVGVRYTMNGQDIEKTLYVTSVTGYWSTRLFRVDEKVDVRTPEIALVKDLKVISVGQEIKLPEGCTHVYVDAGSTPTRAVIGRGTIN